MSKSLSSAAMAELVFSRCLLEANLSVVYISYAMDRYDDIGVARGDT